ncbi:unnamed protein product [Parascedosporium putredinis]|uniref:GST N-terminal domain-containing protein n=1 Tax=Parascedosporium putredinis TaxID=1442378 RepID=A0A9P1H1X8_9PEZI|nr:unnamed protein product [Parascedosporium putredinis]CAI7995573.1 unnamed protein product [Parascedosporium putredinis]
MSPEIILFHYTYSPYARRVAWYLTLRGFLFGMYPTPIMPRPDVARLGINYRRIPLLSIGRDVYLDTRLIIEKLEQLFPAKPKLGATTAAERLIERLLQAFNIDGGIFGYCFQALPTDLPLLRDPVYYKDRADFMGFKVSKESMTKDRADALKELRGAFDLLEHTLLADGRDWVLGTGSPRLADIEAIWPFHWLTGLPGALPAEIFSPSTYPKVYSWIRRFQKHLSDMKRENGRAKPIQGDEAFKTITSSPYSESLGEIDETDPVVVAEALEKGMLVTVWPSDTGSAHKDTGALLAIDKTEIVFETSGSLAPLATVRVHAPRHGFRVTKHGPSQTHL